MSTPADQPLIFLDVDGTLIPLGPRPADTRNPPHPAPLGDPPPGGNPLLNRLNRENGQRLLALGCQLVWATSWTHQANEIISPQLGLPRLPVVDWPDTEDEPDSRLHWKTTTLIGWASGRPFIWLDDEITDADRDWVSTHHPGRALPHRVDPRTGLTAADYSLMLQWLTQP